jgi:gamma-glutamyl-gamma-aminobutyrate hydrolase PuuD
MKKNNSSSVATTTWTGSPVQSRALRELRNSSSLHVFKSLQDAGPSWRDLTFDEDGEASQPISRNKSRRGVESELLGPGWEPRVRPPRVLMVSRRYLRKNKYVDIIGEYHMELVQEFGGAPIIIPRTTLTIEHLTEFLPMDGLVVAEGNDLSPGILQKYGCHTPAPQDPVVAEKYASDAEFDHTKDELEFALMRFALATGCPILAICRGSQMLSALRGGTLINDIESEVTPYVSNPVVHHRDSADPEYDSGRHPITVKPGTPLDSWFSESLGANRELQVNSYHHQAVKDLGRDLSPMAHAPDNSLEGFFDPSYCPDRGKFVVGLQFHPERMLPDYPGCRNVYKDFGKACIRFKESQDKLFRPGGYP